MNISIYYGFLLIVGRITFASSMIPSIKYGYDVREFEHLFIV